MATRDQIESLIKLVTEIASQPGNEWVGKKCKINSEIKNQVRQINKI